MPTQIVRLFTTTMPTYCFSPEYTDSVVAGRFATFPAWQFHESYVWSKREIELRVVECPVLP